MRSFTQVLSFLLPAVSAAVAGKKGPGDNSECVATEYSQVVPTLAACTNVVLRDIAVPSNSALDLTSAKDNSVITFEGTTTFGFTNSSSFNPILLSGNNITITGAPGSVIDGNGQLYWDGLGSNGGVPKPDHFVYIKKLNKGSVIENLHIRNWPVHCFSINSCSDLTIRNLFLDNSAGNAPNNRSNGLAAAHNSDGFDISTSTNVVVKDTTVINQDDCVAVTSGDQITATGLTCIGGHGLSIGSVGGKSANNVTNVIFSKSAVIDSQNGARIKTNYGTTGFVANITYEDILLHNISIYGLDVQQDYLNGGPTGTPTNGVIIENLLFKNLVGTMAKNSNARDYYILCGNGSCSNFVFENVHIVGGESASSCNYPASGCP
uniref:endo-polygalacturonase n=1 Tax=Evansstolkia leycettana TaxID=196907 RepID=A0A221LFZ6_9EURO|nr:endopolygalacturonase [Evansstolkia leycettana]